MNILAIIPARGDSKGLPGKNTLPLAGKPLIAHTIEAATSAPSVDRVIVTTDSKPIATIAQDFGAEVPFLRPKEISGDHASGIDVCLHAIEFMKNNKGYIPEMVIYLQPTSPLRNSNDIEAAIELLTNCKADSVVSLKPVTEYPQWMKTIDNQQRISPLFQEFEIPTTRQELAPSYLLNGAIYLSTYSALIKNKSFYGADTRGYIMPEDRSIDIDTKNDFQITEALISQCKS